MLHVIYHTAYFTNPTEYDEVYYHTTKWDSVDFECNVKTSDCVRISSNRDVTIFYKDWQINGKWETVVQNSGQDTSIIFTNTNLTIEISTS